MRRGVHESAEWSVLCLCSTEAGAVCVLCSQVRARGYLDRVFLATTGVISTVRRVSHYRATKKIGWFEDLELVLAVPLLVAPEQEALGCFDWIPS